MINGARVSMRPFVPDDAEHVYNELCDLETYLIASPLPHVPRTTHAIRQRLEKQMAEKPSPDKDIWLMVTSLADDAVLGTAGLWGIDAFNRFAHFGIALMPGVRRQGYGTDILRTLVDYAFRVRNLRRVELETNASNEAMRKTALRCGFTEEGRLRQRHYDGDRYADLVIYGKLRTDRVAAGADAGQELNELNYPHSDASQSRRLAANVHIG
jgi:RimJ/RimL family protein N-acetyltransferase